MIPPASHCLHFCFSYAPRQNHALCHSRTFSAFVYHRHVFFKDFIYLFLERGEGKKERERNISVREKHPLVASHKHPNCGRNPQPRHVPWPGNESTTFRFARWRSSNWAAPVRAPPRCFAHVQSTPRDISQYYCCIIITVQKVLSFYLGT